MLMNKCDKGNDMSSQNDCCGNKYDARNCDIKNIALQYDFM